VVHLKTGGSVTGTVVTEDSEKVVLKTPQGKLTFPRKLVKAIERQSKGETQLALARERARQGAFAVAVKLYERAAASSDKKAAEVAKSELETLRARMRKEKKRAQARAASPWLANVKTRASKNGLAPTLPPLWGGAFVQETVRAREVVLAIRDGDSRGAMRLLEGANEKYHQDSSYRYLMGRALEVGGRRREATKVYLGLIEGVTAANVRMPISQLNELARRSVSGPAREQLSATSPGASDGWERIETPHFAIYHRFDRVDPWFADAPENALTHALKNLKIDSSELLLSGRIQVFLFENHAAYEAASGVLLAGGHAQTRYTPDGYLRKITSYASRSLAIDTYRHEVSHTLLLELYRAMPSWAHEGAATFVERQQKRVSMRAIHMSARALGTLPQLLDFLRGDIDRGADQAAVRMFYAQASVIFEAMTLLLRGPRPALELCVRMGKSGVGPERALAEVELTLDRLEKACLTVARDRKRDRF
jgi:hypothetical protein